MIQSQGSLSVGGTVVRSPGTSDPAKLDSGGQTLHGDHACVFYQLPVGARPLPLVMWHGFGQTAKTWETTPDGREGFQTLFLRRRFRSLWWTSRAAAAPHAAPSAPRSRRRRMTSAGSTSSVSAPGLASCLACSSRASLQPWNSSSARWCPTPARSTTRWPPAPSRAVRPHRPWRTRHPLAQRRHGLAGGHGQPQRAGHRVL